MFEKQNCLDKWHRGYIPCAVENAIVKWFRQHGIDIGKKRQNYEVSYNDVYHFYDFRFFLTDTDRIKEVLTKEGYRLHVDATPCWQWQTPTEANQHLVTDKNTMVNGRVCVHGQRIWIYLKEDAVCNYDI